jgi:protein PhnA
MGTRQEELDENHFNCLNVFMWSENSAVKVLTYRLLNSLGRQDLIDMMYLEENKLNWAKAGISNEEKRIYLKIKRCNTQSWRYCRNN